MPTINLNLSYNLPIKKQDNNLNFHISNRLGQVHLTLLRDATPDQESDSNNVVTAIREFFTPIQNIHKSPV